MTNTIIIIGAGPAGLTAAYQLQQNTGYKPLILEASHRLGGIATTAEYHGNYMDMGGHRFFTKSKPVLELWQSILPLQGAPSKDELLLQEKKSYEGVADPEREAAVFLKRRRVSRIYYLKSFFSYPISVSLETLKNLGLLNLLQVGFSYCYSMAIKRQECSLEDFYINRFGKRLYQMFFENYTEKIWGIHPSKISPEWGAQRIKGLSIVEILLTLLRKPFGNKQVQTSLIEEFYYPKLGPGQLWQQLADKVTQAGGQLEYDRKVIGLEQLPDKGFRVKAVTAEGKVVEYTAAKVISSMAISDLVRAMGSGVPKEVQQVAYNLPYRDFITVGLLVKRLKLVNNTVHRTVGNIVPDCWIYIQEHGVKLGRLQVFNNWSPYLVRDLEHTVWIGLEYFCNEGDELWQMTKEQFIEFAVEELSRIGVIDRADVLDATQVKVEKAYPAYFGAYKDFEVVKGYLKKFDNLYCIGRNGQHKYNNMDHSMLTAMEAVNAICGRVDKDIIWEVNTEQEYHEELKK